MDQDLVDGRLAGLVRNINPQRWMTLSFNNSELLLTFGTFFLSLCVWGSLGALVIHVEMMV